MIKKLYLLAVLVLCQTGCLPTEDEKKALNQVVGVSTLDASSHENSDDTSENSNVIITVMMIMLIMMIILIPLQIVTNTMKMTILKSSLQHLHLHLQTWLYQLLHPRPL